MTIDRDALAAALDALDLEGASAVRRSVAAKRDEIRREREQGERDRINEEAMSQDRPIISTANWLESEYYSGPFARNLYPKLKEVMIDICDNNIHEVIMGGAIGWGKSTLARALHARAIYVLSRFANPHAAYRRMIETTPITMKNLNVSEAKAKSAYFVEFYQTIHSIPYFVDEFLPQKGVTNQLRFPKHILCDFAGASKTAAESENLILVVLDEINLYDDVEKSKRSDTGEKYDEAVEVHSAALRRQQTRFMMPDGTMPEPCFLISLCKETYPDSFIRRRMKEIRKQGLDVDTMDEWGKLRKRSAIILEFAEWETKPKDFYEKKYFWISTGTRNREAKILRLGKYASLERTEIRGMVESGVEKDDIPELIRVPLAGGQYLRSAEEKLDEFIRDVCGRPTEAIGQFFKNREVIYSARRAVGDHFPWNSKEQIPREVCEHPLTDEQTDFKDQVKLVPSRLARRVVERDEDGEYDRWEPIVAPNAPRYAHVDMGLSNDSAGVAVCCPAGWMTVRRTGKEGEVETSIEPLVWFDLLLRVNPPPGGQIQFSDIRRLFVKLQRLGFRFAMGTADGFQSANLLQDFADMGMETEVVSTVLTPDPYNNLRDLYNRGLVSTYEHSFFEKELRNLERRVMKVRSKGGIRSYESIDHPARGSKDVADAAAGAAWNAYRRAKEDSVQAPAPFALEKDHADPVAAKHEKGLAAREAMRTGRLERLFDMDEDF